MADKVLDIRGLPETKKLLRSLSGQQLQNRVRQGTRAGIAVMRKELRARAQSSEFPKTFRKTRTAGHRNPVGTSTAPSSSLVNIFEPGAGPHPIGSTRGQLLHSQQGEPFFAARAPVQHPGMAARPIIAPTFEATKEEAAQAAMDTIFTERPRNVPELG
jgi:hypothetical protein